MNIAVNTAHPDHSPLKTASVALTIESRLVRYYGELANRLRPFDPGINQLLEVLAQEREQQREQVRRLACAMFGTLRLLNLPCKRQLRHPATGHFFILNWQDATALVQRAARLERRTSRFYHRCATGERLPQLRHLYWDLGECDDRRAEVLMEAIEAYGQTPDRSRANA